jgi:hypothetical protein
MRIWLCKVFLFMLASDFFTCRKILRHGASDFIPPIPPSSEGRRAADFYRP